VRIIDTFYKGFQLKLFMLLWIAILLLLDAGLALWFERRVRIILPGWNINVLALIEAAVAVVCIAVHFLTRT